MANNPMFSSNVSPNGATVPGASVNDAHKNYKRGYNTFNLRRPFYTTQRYAEVSPFEAVEGVEGDRLPFSSRHEVRSHTMQAPLMSGIEMRKSYFYIPMKALLPINWSKYYQNPTAPSDDVDSEVGPVITNDQFKLDNLFANTTNAIKNGGSVSIDEFLHYMLLLEAYYSNGSLSANLGYHVSSRCTCTLPADEISGISDVDVVSFDTYFDYIGAWLVNNVKGEIHVYSSLASSNSDMSVSASYFVNFGNSEFARGSISWREAFDVMRNSVYFTFTQLDDAMLEVTDTNMLDFVKNIFPLGSTMPFNYSRLLAYQIVCAQFYSNDFVDSIYTAQLYRDNMASIYRLILGYISTFTYNGVTSEYDVLSGFCVGRIFLNLFALFTADWSSFALYRKACLWSFYMNIFGFRRSLRYGDYFTGARPRPLAVGDTNTAVVDGSVNALDLTRNLMVQRFLNAVQRVGRRTSEYIRDVMDGVSAPPDTEARFLMSFASGVGNYEVENTTSEDQGSVVTVMKSSDSRFVYEVQVGEPCIILGVVTYSIPRVYSKTIDRFFFHEDRFDMFNKFMQYIGDQEIYRSELTADDSNSSMPFAYTLRHMEYKQRFPIAAGGFVENLPGYAFITDQIVGLDRAGGVYSHEISSDYIRSRNAEMDQFYKSLTGFSLASYFHFIVKFENGLNARRQMEYSPSIL